MFSLRLHPVTFAFVCLVLFASHARAATNTTATWSATPTDGNYTTTTNWSGGDYPNGTTARAVFGASNITTVNVASRLLGTTLEFTSSATTPYTLNFANLGTNIHSLTGIVNDSAWSPTLIFQEGANLTLNGGSLADATLIFTSGSVFTFKGSGGTSTLYLNSGSTLAYNRASDGQNARLILNGTLAPVSSSDIITYTFGSIEGAGTIDLSSNSLTVGSNNRNTVFSGTITGISSTATITKTGSGTWTLSAANNSNASVNVTGGTLAIDSDARLGTGGPLTLDGGTLQATASFTGLRGLILGAGGGTLDTQGYSITQTGALSGSGAFTKTGSGTLTLAAASTNTGGVTLAAGTLTVGDDAALGTGTLTLAGGTLAASGARTLANAVTLTGDTTLGGSSALTSTGAWTLAASRTLTVANSALTTIAGTVSESSTSALLKAGSGTLVLTGANTYTGGTLISAGMVKINNTAGSAFGTGAVTVASGATLTGAGYFSGALQNNGSYAPGNSPTLATLSSFSQGSTGALDLEIGGLTRGTGYDALDIAGSASLDGTLNVTFYGTFTPADLHAGDAFDLFNWGSVSGTFETINLADLSAYGLAWDTSALYTTGVLSVASSASAVPEPSTYAALAGLAALGFVVWRRRVAV